MSVYSAKGKGWRYDFTHRGERYTEAWFKTKREAQAAEAKRREELKKPRTKEETPTDITFLQLVNFRLDHVKAYNSLRHYKEYTYMAKRWVKRWGGMECRSITPSMVEKFILERNRAVSPLVANKEIRYLRSTYNYGKKKGLVQVNPLDRIEFLPIVKKVKHVPSPEDIDRVIAAADPETQDYLWVIRETMGRVSEINRLTWNDVDFKDRCVILYTRKKKGGHLTPRKLPMTQTLFHVLHRRYEDRDPSKPWVFWHTYISSKTRETCAGPYQDRKKIMKTLCSKAGVDYFRFHALRHSGASVMERHNVPIGSIQRILGHENRSTTEIYLHSINDSERIAMQIFERVRENSHTNSHTTEKRG